MLLLNSNLGPILPRFRDVIACVRRKQFFHTSYSYQNIRLVYCRVMMLGSAKSERPRLTNREIIFEIFQPV